MGRLSRLFGGFRSSKRSQQDVPESSAAVAWIVAGLGNPGKEYAGSRHNTGAMAADRLAGAKHAAFSRRRFGGVTAETEIAGQRTILVKSDGYYYNESGQFISPLLGYFKVPPERLIVVHDELDLEPGRIRIKIGGGDAGNRGVRSVAESLGTPDFIRVRIGVGRPPADDEDHRHILKPLSRAEVEQRDAVLERAAQAIDAIVADGIERAMGRYNQRP
ncbi:MAG TPA: aminoacyl-tRNA hydrolase [Candidatus Binataceae bacterium]|nr:aminoacyl-tRNA hydrolase [Candidatus Binataceae bacterium]